MVKSKATDYVTSEPAPSVQENHGGAIAKRTQRAIGNQARAAVADMQVVEAMRDSAVDAIAQRISEIVDPDRFTSDIYDRVAEKLDNKSLAYRPVFGEVAIDVEAIRAPIRQRPSVSDFLALPAGDNSQQSFNGYEPLSIGAGDDADYQD